MKNMREILVLVLCAVLLCTLSACSSKRAGKVHIFSEDHQAEYEKAAKDLFSTVEWTKADFLDSIGDQMGELEDGSTALKLDAIGADDKFVVIIGGSADLLEREGAGGKRYTVYVVDDGSSDLQFSMRYRVGTTENSVFKGNTIEGEMSVNRAFTVTASGVTDPAERAKLIFSALNEMVTKTEGK